MAEDMARAVRRAPVRPLTSNCGSGRGAYHALCRL